MSIPAVLTFPPNFASASVFTIFLSSIPRAIESARRLAVRFITARAPSILWKNRSLSVEAAIFGACISAETGSSTSTTSPFSRIFSINSRIVTAPAFYKVMFNSKMVKDTGNNHVHQVVYCIRVMVEPRAGRHNYCSCILGSKHVLQMDL